MELTLRPERAPVPAIEPPAPTSLADKVFPPQPSLADRLRTLPGRAGTALAARLPQQVQPRPVSQRLPDARRFWGRTGRQWLSTNRRELSLGLRISAWLSSLWHRAFVKLVRWSWGQRHSRLFGFAWRAVRKTLHAEWLQMNSSFKMLGSAFLLWQKAALKAAWWDLRRRFRRSRNPLLG